MDLRIKITDENGDTLKNLTVYQDGSDSEGANRIEQFIRSEYSVEEDIPENTGYTDDEWQHGYTVFEAEGFKELQKIHDRGKFSSDGEAVNQLRQDLQDNDPFARHCLNKLIHDHGRNDGRGRGGNAHDMDFFSLWKYVE